MKALIINSQGHQEEAFALAKEALKNDMKSHVCWHVYGLLWRSAKNFDEAIKAYKFALKLEPESQQIQRDLALLQIQMRDYQGYVQSRRAMLQGRPALRSNWTALAVAQHLAGELADAERTLTTYEETLRTPPPKTDSEHAEAVLYKNTIIAEMGEIERALEHIEAVGKSNFDRQGAMEMQATYLLKLGRKEEAEKVYREMLARNAEYRPYYDGLQAALGLDESKVEELRDLYLRYAESNPRGDAAQRIPLDFLEGHNFREAADRYLQKMLHKSVPSIFANIKALYTDTAKRSMIQELAESYVSGTHNPRTNGTSEKQVNGESSLFESFALYFLAQHYNYNLTRHLPRAMELIDKAIEMFPKSVDFHMTKARILKHQGNIQKAAEMMETARALDERDRYINSKAAKYQLRNDENEKAIETMKKFTRNETAGGPLGDLHDMQCMWYITEDGESYLRQHKLGLALKRFHAIYNIFETWQEDQFDFHSFSMRKGQIRAYVDMIRWQDHLHDHPFFSRAAISAIKAYVLLHDKPQLAHGALNNGVNGVNGKLDANEQKKAAKRARKAQEKQDQIDAEKKDAKKTAGVGADGEPKKEDKDPKGEKLVQTEDPLKDAMKFLTPLLEHSPKYVEAQEAGFEVYFRRSKYNFLSFLPSRTSESLSNSLIEKYLLATRCLLALSSLQPNHLSTHYQLIRLRHTLASSSASLNPKVLEIINTELSTTFPDLKSDTDLSKINDDLLQKKESAAHVIIGLQAREFLAMSSRGDNIKDMIGMVRREDAGLDDAMRGLDTLRDWDADTKEYLEAARQRWPVATIFQT